MKSIKKISILFLCIFLFFPTLALAQDVETESKEVMNEILANAEQIKSAEKNLTVSTQLLASLPEAEEKPRIAIYNIADKTGKIDEDGSRVLTQGATGLVIGGTGGTKEHAVASTALDIRLVDTTTGEVVWSPV